MKTIEYKVSYEKMISRLPGLFAYLDYNQLGECELHHATDNSMGCYGKIVENIKLPYGVELILVRNHKITESDVENGYYWFDNNNEKNVAKEEVIDTIIQNFTFVLEEESTYSYRTLIDYYYQYKDTELFSNDTSVEDVDYIYGHKHFIEFMERGIGKKYITDDILIAYGLSFKENNLIPSFIYLATARSMYDEMLKTKKLCDFYAEQEEKDEHICCICDEFERKGGEGFIEILEVFIAEAKETQEEYFGYADHTDNPMKINLSVDLEDTIEDMGIVTPLIEEWKPNKRVYAGQYVIYEGNVYKHKESEISDYSSGKWDKETERNVFDEENYDKEDLLEFTDMMSSERENLLPLVIDGQKETELQSLRRKVTFIDYDLTSDKPQDGTDWLFYYRKGKCVSSSVNCDSLGNVRTLIINDDGIIKESETIEHDIKVDDYIINLAAYGNVITDITYNKNEKTITFEYITNAHMKAKLNEEKKDDDGNILYILEEFVYDSDSNFGKNIGTKFTETYTYEEGSDLDMLINGEYKLYEDDVTKYYFGVHDEADETTQEEKEMPGYIGGQYDKILSTVKFEFNTSNTRLNYIKRIGTQEVTIPYNETDYTIYRNTTEDFMNVPIIRMDYYQGISYAPTKDIQVRIERGNTSVFEKHIKFSEIKTLEDMAEYSNGSFFKINEG